MVIIGPRFCPGSCQKDSEYLAPCLIKMFIKQHGETSRKARRISSSEDKDKHDENGRKKKSILRLVETDRLELEN